MRYWPCRHTRASRPRARRRLLAPAILVCLVAPGVATAQLACRAMPGGAPAPALAQTEAWPALGDELVLGRDVRADLLSDGSAVVIDRSKLELLRVDRKSGRVTTLAHKGPGPGEIGSVVGVVVTVGDTIVVLDLSKRRAMRLGLQGNLIAAPPYQPAGLPFPVLLAASGGDVIEVTRNRPQRGKAEPPVMIIRTLDQDSARVARTVELSDPPSEPGIFTPNGVAGLLDDTHVVVASGVTPDIRVVALRGAADGVIHLGIGPPQKLTRDFAERVMTQALTQVPAQDRPRMIASMLGALPLAPSYPMFARMLAGTSGSLWVQRTYPAPDDASSADAPATFSMDDLGGFVWQQFGRQGALTAECRTPSEWRVVLARRGEILFAEDDATATRFFTWRPR